MWNFTIDGSTSRKTNNSQGENIDGLSAIDHCCQFYVSARLWVHLSSGDDILPVVSSLIIKTLCVSYVTFQSTYFYRISLNKCHHLNRVRQSKLVYMYQ